MANKRKYPKAFYDDGLGDILEWIDDEVLVHSDTKEFKNKSKNKRLSRQSLDDESDLETERTKKKSKSGPSKNLKLYGDNDLDKVLNKKSKEVEWNDFPEDELSDHEGSRTKRDKNIEDRTRGLINRLAAQTMPYVSSEFEKLYSSNSRTDLNSAIFGCIESSVIMKSAVAKRKLVAELMLLVSYLDSKISHNIGATIIHKFIKQFESLYREGTGDEDKRLDNIVFCLANLYTTGLISSNVMFELTKRICSPDDFRAKSVELLLIILKNVGFQLRKENPSLMRQLILMSHEQCKALRSDSDLDARISFIMDALDAIKNNNMSKIGNYGCDIDRDTIESTLKSLVKRTKLPEALSDAIYGEILNSGNWYLLDTRVDEMVSDDIKSHEKSLTDKLNSKKELKICKALGLNKPAERTIFGALARVSDFVEASNIIISYGMNHCSDAMVVIMQVAIYEKKYNQFYFNVINNLCKFNRKYKIAAKFSIQDKIRGLSDMPSRRVMILSRLCLDLIKSDAIPITVLKAVEWANLSESTKQFLTFLLESISNMPEEEKRRVMVKSDKRSSFAGAMRTFSKCFLTDCLLFD